MSFAQVLFLKWKLKVQCTNSAIFLVQLHKGWPFVQIKFKNPILINLCQSCIAPFPFYSCRDSSESFYVCLSICLSPDNSLLCSMTFSKSHRSIIPRSEKNRRTIVHWPKKTASMTVIFEKSKSLGNLQILSNIVSFVFQVAADWHYWACAECLEVL